MNLPTWTAAPQPGMTVTHSTGDVASETCRRMYAAVATAYFSAATFDALDWSAPASMGIMEFNSHEAAVAAMELLAMPTTGGVQ